MASLPMFMLASLEGVPRPRRAWNGQHARLT